MIDLNSTWCLNTEENYNALEKLKIEFVGDYCKTDKYLVIQSCFSSYSEIEDKPWFSQINKQIHLISGEFQYVETKSNNNFKDYGFEADFEGEILSDIEDYYIGYYVEKYPCIIEKQKIPTFWDKNTGNCYKGAGISNSKFTLKLIQKEWYEKEDTFRIAVRQIKSLNDFSPVFGQIQIMQKTTDDKGISQYIIGGHNTPVEWLKCYQPATKEEVLSLLVKE